MSGDDAFFVARAGAVWACFLNGNPAVKLGTEEQFWAAVTTFYDERHPPGPPSPSGPIAAGPSTTRSDLPGSSGHDSASPADPVIAASVGQHGENAKADAPPSVRTANERGAPRHLVSIVGRVFASGGSREAIISDLSTTGCKFDDYSGRPMKTGAHLTIRIGTVGPVPATVRWSEGATNGVLFDTALHPSVLEHIRLQFGRAG